MTVLEDQARLLFLATLDQVPEQWSAYLDAACGSKTELRERVEELLRAHQSMGSIQMCGPGGFRTTLEAVFAEQPGEVIGPYKLLEQIGEGGFGVVFLAEQTVPVRRKVALKVLKPGMDTKQVVARFEAERQALAIMDHPNIAKVLDGGATSTGRPYFVMELVKGIPITEFCDQNRLTLRQRLALFLQVCQAVQHAHQKGIIHRDLKPTNVLVSRHDTTPVVKVIDFGVAKALAQTLTDKTLFTGIAQMIGTPLYMSPEQAGMSDLDVDTRSDIYSLGVLLYELLTGTTPFTKERFKAAGYDEIRRIIREEEPPKPSTRVSTLGQVAETVSAARGSAPGELRRLFRNELDWIVMKAMEKDRNRRYETAGALAADVQRYMNDEPLQACPPSTWYRFRKLARRNRRALVTVSALGLAILVGIGALTVSTVLVWEANKNLKHSLERERVAAGRERRDAYFQRISVAHRELSVDNLVAALRALNECPEDVRGWEWYYLMRLCKVEPLVIPARTEVHGIAFSPDEERIASVGDDGFVRIWNSRTGQLIQEFKAHDKTACGVAFHPGGEHLASTGADGWVKVWHLASGQEVFRGECDALRAFGTAYTVAFRPTDGAHLAAGSGGAVRVWDWKSRKLIHTFPGHDNHSIPVAFSHDGQRLVSSDAFHSGPRIWDAEAGGSPLRTFPAHGHPVSSVALSPDGALLASASLDRTVKLWDTATGELRYTCLHPGQVMGFAFSPNGHRWASTGLDKVVHVWDATTGREVLGLRGHTGMCGCVVFSPDGLRIASGSTDGTIRVWDATPPRSDEHQEMLTFTKHSEDIRSVAVSPDGLMIASAGTGSKTKVWDAMTGEIKAEFNAHGVIVFCVAWCNHERIVTAGSDIPLHNVKVWDVQTRQEVIELRIGGRNFTGAYNALACSPDGRYLVTGHIGGTVQVWDAKTSQEIGTLGYHDREVRGLAFSRDGKHLASASGDGKVKLWDATKLDKRYLDKKPVPRHALQARVPGPSLNIAFSPDGERLVTGGEENTVKIWGVKTGEELRTLRGHNGDIHAVAFSPDAGGRWIASAGEDSAVKVWDSQTGKLVRNFRGHTDLVSSLTYSPDGLRLYSGSYDHTVKVWDVSKLPIEPNR